MTLSSALAIANSSFIATAAQSATISRNIANADTPGYVREIANQLTNAFGGADVVSVSRQVNSLLLDQLNTSTSESANQTAISAGISQLAQSISDSATSTTTSGANQNGASPYAMLSNLDNALVTYQATPSNASAAQAVVTAARNFATALNNGSNSVNQVRQQADANMATSVKTMNSLLTQFQAVNATIVNGLASGSDVSSAQDQRDSILTQLSQQIGVSTTTNTNGSMSIYADSGVTLFQDTPRTVTFTPSQTLLAGMNGNAVTVDGIPITGASAPMAIQSGALAGYAQLRDNVAPQYQAQLDSVAGGAIAAFAESDQTGGFNPTLPGLFTFPGASGVPGSNNYTGLASAITVHPNVDPSQGGSLSLLRDGGIASPGNPAYIYNTSGAASFTGRIQQLMSGLSTAQTFSASGGLVTSGGLSDYANQSVSWLQGQNQQASDAASFQTSLASGAANALSNATGVNLDTEMTHMLNIENSYSTSAKLLTTVNAMFSALLNAA